MAESGLILASASPRRRDLLGQIGIAIDGIDPADIDETPRPHELPRHYAMRMAEEKLAAAAPCHGGAFVLAADTVVACGRRILPKTHSQTEAARCLDLLSGRRHRVYGAIALACPDGRHRTRLVQTVVQFKTLSQAERAWYLTSGEWDGKAGGYAIQGRAAALIRFVSGSYSNVVGLPLFETAALLKGAGFTMG